MEELHKLIQSLSKDEKREFKLKASVYKTSTTSNHVRLFDFLEKTKTLDEKALEKKIAEGVFGKQFAITKQKLWDTLLESLASNSSSITVRRKLLKEIEHIDILLEHGCLKLAKRKIQHAIKDAIAIDNHLSIIKLCHQYQFVIIDAFLKDEPYEHLYAYELPYESAAKFQLHVHFYYANLRLKEIILRSKFDQEEGDKTYHVNKIIKEYLEAEIPEKYKTIQVMYNRFMAYDLANFHLNQREKSLSMAREVIAIFESHPVHFKENIKGYTSLLFSMVMISKELKDWNSFEFYLDKMKGTVLNEPTLLSHYILFLQNLRIQRLYYLDKMEEFDELYEESIAYMNNNTSESSHVKYFFNIMAAKLFFNKGDFKKSLEICNNLRNSLSKDIFEVHSAAYILFFLLHLSLDNLDVVEHHIELFKKYLAKWHYESEMDEIFINFLNDCISHPDPKLIKTNMSKAWDQLQKFKNGTKFNHYFEFLDIPEWLKRLP